MTEDDLHKIVSQWLDHALPAGSVYHHSPNEGRRHVAYATRLKALGMKSGWPDLEIFVPTEHFMGSLPKPIFIELKAPSRGKLSANQKSIQAELIAAGCLVVTVNTLAKVKAYLAQHIKINDNAKMQWLEQIAQAKGG